MKTREERILVLCKTYPSPSAKYSETSCVAGITEPGNLIRLYPVPFRLVNDEQQHGQNWETPFRAKIEQQLPSKDLMFLMGTIHRFPDQWLIVSLFYPPKLQPDAPVQESLFSQ